MGGDPLVEASVGGGLMNEVSAPARWRWQHRQPNPLLVKELRGRMRGARAFVLLTVYLLLLSCLTSLIYYVSSGNFGPGSGPNAAYLGKVIFSSVVLIELFLVSFIPPALTASAICGERERKTYEVLRTTLLSARRLVTGKLTSVLAYVFILILATVPLKSLAFMLGGVEVEELVLALLILLVTAFAFAAMGLFCSAIARTTRVATALSGGLVALLVLGPLFLVVLSGVLFDFFYSGTLPSFWEIVLAYMFAVLCGTSPIMAAIFTERALVEQGSIWYFRQTVGTRSVPIPSPWIVFVLLYVILGLVLLWLAILWVRRQEVQ